MKAIKTSYLGATNHRGARIKASDGDNSITINYEYELDTDTNHIRGAQALRKKLKLPGLMVMGWLKNDVVHVFVKTKSEA